MKNLMKMLADSGDDDAQSSPMDSAADDDDTAVAGADEGFNAAAEEAFSALETKDVDAFTSALKTCIDMSR